MYNTRKANKGSLIVEMRTTSLARYKALLDDYLGSDSMPFDLLPLVVVNRTELASSAQFWIYISFQKIKIKINK